MTEPSYQFPQFNPGPSPETNGHRMVDVPREELTALVDAVGQAEAARRCDVPSSSMVRLHTHAQERCKQTTRLAILEAYAAMILPGAPKAKTGPQRGRNSRIPKTKIRQLVAYLGTATAVEKATGLGSGTLNRMLQAKHCRASTRAKIIALWKTSPYAAEREEACTDSACRGYPRHVGECEVNVPRYLTLPAPAPFHHEPCEPVPVAHAQPTEVKAALEALHQALKAERAAKAAEVEVEAERDPFPKLFNAISVGHAATTSRLVEIRDSGKAGRLHLAKRLDKIEAKLDSLARDLMGLVAVWN